MHSDQVIALVEAHLDAGEEVKLSIDKDGRRFVKLSRMVVFGSTFEISGATEATAKRMLASRRGRSQRRGDVHLGPASG